ncbi:universal stress protein [Streptomonospora nanhaiensis]|uniref:universal stress protein n=1 Tax=Streptomonospora nanhaiensis TaxID=1323731 RepID=UPI001C37F684|nr:universal stress protein [Streptomonospora nanhaiensis]MBV2364150.1 universal stress protein [Streptomonospora nanhaiensis]MBX9389455.1 universal stress protein [Streptomonospora nanhaiensis]
MAATNTAPVLAAVDETDASLRALDWAADEAVRRRRPLRIHHVFDWPMRHSDPRGLPGFNQDEYALRVIDPAERRARERAPGLAVTADFHVGDVAPRLLLEAARADLVVVGSRGLSSVGAAALGSVGQELAASARCPVVVVPDRDPKPPTGRIVVGVDGSAPARAAAAWAFAAAEERGAAVRAVAVHGRVSHGPWSPLDLPAALRLGPADEAAAREEAGRLLSESVAGERERHPGVAVEEVVAAGHAAQLLVDEAENADLLVVGSRGRGGFAGMLLGSVSRTVLSHAASPVAVLHAADV